jgi:hypothetical protein
MLSRFEIKNYVWKIAANDPNSPFFKRRRWKEVKEDPNLVANGRRSISTFSPFHHFTSSHFPPTNFT